MRRIVCILGSFILLALSSAPAEAGPFRGRARAQPAVSTCQAGSCSTNFTVSSTSSNSCANGVCTLSTSSASTVVTVASATALDEVNAKRAARGLRPFVHDPALTAAAERCAAFRAERRLFGHTGNDFGFLGGARASAAGCAAYEAHYGWLSCCTYDSYTYAGAAFVVGADGKRYMHLFVR